jgi:hypothetical protein
VNCALICAERIAVDSLAFVQQALTEDAKQKDRNSDKLATPHAGGFLPDAIQPFKAQFPYPKRSAFNTSGVKIEQTTNADGKTHVQIPLMAGNPQILFRSTKGDQ